MTEFSDRQIRLQRAGKKEYSEEEVRLIIEGAKHEEREACAKVAESYEPRCDTCPSGVSNAIRARREQ